MPFKDKDAEKICKTKALRAAKVRALAHYSDGTMCCKCCGEAHLEFLSIDHIYGGGGKHRKEVGSPIWYWLSARGYPPGFQVLCHNCNQAKGYFGECPHEKERREKK